MVVRGVLPIAVHGPQESLQPFVDLALDEQVFLPVPRVHGGNGLPLGVQVAAIHGNDHVTIAVAEHLERSFGGWVPPSLSWCRR